MDVVARPRSRTPNPLAAFAVVLTSLGAGLSIAMWMARLRPTSPLLGEFAHELAYGGPLRDQVVWLAATLGAVGIVATLFAVIGGRPKPSTVACLLLGAIALSYPVLVLSGTIGPPIDPPRFMARSL